MSEAESQEGRPLPRGGTPPLRFRELLHRLFSIANQGFVRLEFLQMAGGAILECLGGDVLEVRVEEAGRVYWCRATVGEVRLGRSPTTSSRKSSGATASTAPP